MFSRADEQVGLDAIEQLSETFYEKVYEYTQTNVDATYLEAVNAVLPLTTTIPAQPTEVVVLIQNNSDNISATATKVRLFLTMDRPVTSCNVKSREPYSLVEGDIGEHQITIEVDRIVAGDSIEVVVASEGTELETQRDQIVMRSVSLLDSLSYGDLAADFAVSALQYIDALEVIEKKRPFPFLWRPLSPEAIESSRGPGLMYIPAQEPDIRVEVTSSEGQATLK